MSDIFSRCAKAIADAETIRPFGVVVEVRSSSVVSEGPQASLGECCKIIAKGGAEIFAEVVAIKGKFVTLVAFDSLAGVESGSLVFSTAETQKVPVGAGLLGRVIDGLGRPIDGKGGIAPDDFYPVLASPPNPITRPQICKKIATGIRAIDGLLTLGKGQRIGVFAGSGVGKSTLLSMIARNTSADINVIALIGERGREVNEFISRDLGEEGLARSVVVVATGDSSPMIRVRGSYLAMSIAEYFRDQGKDVMLMFDNVTRFAKAQSEIGAESGELPTKRGYTPSVFENLPKLLERAGTSEKGTITGIFAVLVDGGDLDEPISDAVRGTLDGHIVLSRELQQMQHLPAIDISASISRLCNRVTGAATKLARTAILRSIAVYERNEDMINVGAYAKGSSVEIDAAIASRPAIEAFLCQEPHEKSTFPETFASISAISGVQIPESEA